MHGARLPVTRRGQSRHRSRSGEPSLVDRAGGGRRRRRAFQPRRRQSANICGPTIVRFPRALIGTVLLSGLVSKNGILLVDFANSVRERGRRREAIVEAAHMRFRPIVMTTLSMVSGMLPIALAIDPGSDRRRALGVVVIGGLTSSLVHTLFIVPIMYLWLAPRDAVRAHSLDEELLGSPGPRPLRVASGEVMRVRSLGSFETTGEHATQRCLHQPPVFAWRNEKRPEIITGSLWPCRVVRDIIDLACRPFRMVSPRLTPRKNSGSLETTGRYAAGHITSCPLRFLFPAEPAISAAMPRMFSRHADISRSSSMTFRPAMPGRHHTARSNEAMSGFRLRARSVRTTPTRRRDALRCVHRSRRIG